VETTKIDNLKIAALIPDRNDRPKYLELCLAMLEYQTHKVDHIELVNYPAESDKPDLTQRYRRGYEKLSAMGFDLIFFIENDDFYSRTYIEEMLRAWEAKGKPDLFGTSFTTYYHIGLRKHFKFEHPQRASAMNTLIKTNLKLKFPKDDYIFTDMFIWERYSGTKATWTPSDKLSIGIKHGEGLCGCRQHLNDIYRFKEDDKDLTWLSERVKENSIFQFYSSKFVKK